MRYSTQEVPRGDRFDFCRTLIAGSRFESPLGRRGDYFGDFRFAVTSGVIEYVEMEVDPCFSRFGAGGDDSSVVVGVFNAGHMHIRHGKDQTLDVHAGLGPVMFDPGRPMTARTTHIDTSYLRFSRAAIVDAVGGDAVPRGMAVRPLPSSPLTGQLQDCVRALKTGSREGAAATLQVARALVLVALAGSRGGGHHWSDALDDALFDVAIHQLAQHVGNPGVTVEQVAATLGCSRAQLYRVFAARGEAVEECLCTLRMQHAARLLVAHPRLDLDLIAQRCGYGESMAFRKAFRRHFGMTPRDWRAAQHGAEDVVAA